MRVYIVCDMEGITGVTAKEQTLPGSPDYQESRRLLMSDLNAAIQGAVRAGAEECLVYDMHCEGRNVIMEQLPPQARVICGKPPRTEGPGKLDPSFAALFLVGFHSRGGAGEGLLAHTYDVEDTLISVNGLDVGEIGMEALIAGHFGVPLALVSGDSAGCAEAKALQPGTICASVKESAGLTAGICYGTAYTRKLIEQAAYEAIKRVQDNVPVTTASPVTLRFVPQAPQWRDYFAHVPGLKHVDGGFELRGEDPAYLWDRFNASRASILSPEAYAQRKGGNTVAAG